VFYLHRSYTGDLNPFWTASMLVAHKIGRANGRVRSTVLVGGGRSPPTLAMMKFAGLAHTRDAPHGVYSVG
jgi:hypothetical protein